MNPKELPKEINPKFELMKFSTFNNQNHLVVEVKEEVVKEEVVVEIEVKEEVVEEIEVVHMVVEQIITITITITKPLLLV